MIEINLWERETILNYAPKFTAYLLGREDYLLIEIITATLNRKFISKDMCRKLKVGERICKDGRKNFLLYICRVRT